MLRHNSEQEETKETDKEDVELPLIDLDTIVTATNNFSINNKLEEGGFGPVYKMKHEANSLIGLNASTLSMGLPELCLHQDSRLRIRS